MREEEYTKMELALNDEKIYIRPSPTEEALVRSLPNVKKDRKTNAWVTDLTIENLKRIGGLVRLPQKMAEELNRMEDVQRKIDSQRTADTVEPLFPYPVKVKLYTHQIRAANMAMYEFTKPHKGFGLLFEMGCGKTITAIAIAGQMFKMGKIQRLLVVTPSSVVPVWGKEFGSFAAFPFELAELVGTIKKRVKLLSDLKFASLKRPFPLQVAVINYEGAWREGIFEELKGWKPDMIICDESQKIKNHAADQSKAMHVLGDTALYKMILSGTPVQNSAMDVFSQYLFLNPSVFGDNFYKFRARYAVMGGFNGKQVVGAKDLDLLTKKAHTIACRVTKAEALDLPEKVFITREIELSSKERKLYDTIRKDSYAELEQGEVTAALITTRLLRLQQITGGYIRTDKGDNPVKIGSSKLDVLEDIINSYVIDAGRQIVIFAQFIPEIDGICKMLKDKKIPFGCIDGSVKQEERGEIVNDFQQGKTKVFVGQLQAAGTGITLHSASCVVYYSISYNYATYAQSTDRIHRIGQENKCTYIHLVGKNTVDMQILKALDRKENLARTIVDDWKKYFS